MKEKYINDNTLKILGLFLDDYKKFIHIREIARKIKADTKTTSSYIKKLENLRIVNTKYIGKHKEVYLNTTNSLTPYFLILSEVYRCINFLKKNFKIKRIVEEVANEGYSLIIFGSYAKGIANEESDLDLILIDGKISEDKIEEIEESYGIKISPYTISKKQFANMQRKKDSFFREILGSHIIIKGFSFFVLSTWKYYYEL